MFVILTMNFSRKNGGNVILAVFYYLNSWILNLKIRLKQCSYEYFIDIGGIGFKSGRQSRAGKTQPFYLHH